MRLHSSLGNNSETLSQKKEKRMEKGLSGIEEYTHYLPSWFPVGNIRTLNLSQKLSVQLLGPLGEVRSCLQGWPWMIPASAQASPPPAAAAKQLTPVGEEINQA